MTAPRLTTGVLEPKHVAAAAGLLGSEFCRREPLCRILRLKEAELLPFFTQLTAYVAEHKLGIVAVDHTGEVKGVVLVEDHLEQFPMPDGPLPSGLEAIGQYLELSAIPPELQPKKTGELYLCNLAAVAKGAKAAQVLPLMIFAIYKHLRALGYSHGYAKVTNPKIVAKFKSLERFAFKVVFSCTPMVPPPSFLFHGDYPFKRYEGTASLVTWPMA